MKNCDIKARFTRYATWPKTFAFLHWQPSRRIGVHPGVLSFLGLLFVLSFRPSLLHSCEPVDIGYRDFSFGTTGNSTPTGEKPESKLWWNDGFWWGSLYNNPQKEYRIYRFDLSKQCWEDTGAVLDDRGNSKADVLWDGANQKLYVASHVFTTSGKKGGARSQWGRLYRFTYVKSMKRYVLDSGFPVEVTQGKSETLVLAKDSFGRLWVTYAEDGKVMINRSISSDLDWGVPFVLPGSETAVTVSSDDISAATSFQGNKVGVMWSNQLTSKVYFAVHHDGDADTVWQLENTAIPGPNCSGDCADDHINLAWLDSDGGGRVFAAVKTSQTQPQAPLVMLLDRDAQANWSSHVFGRVQDHHTRPIVLLDEQDGRLFIFASAPEAGGAIYFKSSPIDDINFETGLGTPFIQSSTDTRINNATSTKQNLNGTTGLLVVASDQESRFYFHNFINLATEGAPRIDSFSPTSGPEGTEVLIAGSNFTGTTVVAFSDTNASFEVVSDTEIGTFVPVGATTGRISVTNPAGTGFSAADFTVTAPPGGEAPPVISSFGPSSGPVGSAVTLTGSSFTGATEVAFNSVPTTFTVVSDTQINTLVPNGATTGRISVTNGAGAGFSETDFEVTASSNAPIKDITFESGSLTDPNDGADRVVGTAELETVAPLEGAFAALVPNVLSSYLEQNFVEADDFYVSFYVRLNRLPDSNPRIALISSSGTTIGNIQLRTDGTLQLRAGTTSVGFRSAPLVPGELYRIGVHQRRGTESDALLEAFLALGDDEFGAPFAQTSTGTWAMAADRLRVGATSPAPVDMVVDDIRLDAGAIPGPSSSGP